MHYYQWNIGDYKSHTEHLSEMEDLCYRRLLDWYYLHEIPIPLDLNETARQIRMRSHSDCIAIVLHEYFEQTENGWVHHRANLEIAKAGDKSQKASESAKARWNKHNKTDANEMRRNPCEWVLCKKFKGIKNGKYFVNYQWLPRKDGTLC